MERLNVRRTLFLRVQRVYLTFSPRKPWHICVDGRSHLDSEIDFIWRTSSVGHEKSNLIIGPLHTNILVAEPLVILLSSEQPLLHVLQRGRSAAGERGFEKVHPI
jgi:hypothetical protein